MNEIFSEVMQGFNALDNPLEYICAFLSFLVLTGAFFRLLFSMFRGFN